MLNKFKQITILGLIAALALSMAGCLDEPETSDPGTSDQAYDSRMSDDEMKGFIHDEVESVMPSVDYGS